MTNDQAASDMNDAQSTTKSMIDDISGIEVDARNWGDGADSVEEAAGAAREALEDLNKALGSALSQLD